MPHTCSKCSRVNPDDAVYCYYDGIALNGHGRAGGPIAMGAQTFPSAFIFPSGRSCRNFNELAVACQEDWSAARDVLQQGFLGSFFGGLGRADLARAADEARHFPDHDRGLDQLLGKLPSTAVPAPQLRVDPLELNLGTLNAGEERKFALHLDNQGMRLVYGSVSCEDCPWLSLGEGANATQKLFQFGHETIIPVHVRSDKLRASNKPIEGRLSVESNAGAPVTVVIRAAVPVKPYAAGGVLAGAKSPRQVAEKAKAHPKEAAVLFERGDVAEWYKSNGWTYPVQGPSASGLGAVQQFFEALGLTPAPKVEISERAVAFTGNVGDGNLQRVLEIRTQEKKPVFAHGASNQTWLNVGRAKLNGRVATIPISVPSVPNRPGETLSANVVIQANGNQRFIIPVTLSVTGNFDFNSEPAPVIAEVLEVEPLADMPTAVLPAASIAPPEPPPVVVAPRPRHTTGSNAGWLHAAPAILLVICLVIAVIVDQSPRGSGGDEPDKPGSNGGGPKNPPPIEVAATMQDLYKKIRSSRKAISVEFSDDMRFGITSLDQRNPKNREEYKKLTYERNGGTNNTIILINGTADYFGKEIGGRTEWSLEPKLDGTGKTRSPDYFLLDPKNSNVMLGCRRTMKFIEHKVFVTQTVLLVPGRSGALDTCLVWYTVRNEDPDHEAHVAVRVLLDTYIGTNDGVPFLVPGQKGFLDQMQKFSVKDAKDPKNLKDDPPDWLLTVEESDRQPEANVIPEIPPYIEAVENPNDEKNHGAVVRVGLRGLKLPDPIGELDAVTSLIVCRYPKNPQAKWEFLFQPMKLPEDQEGDSCVALYWSKKILAPGKFRNLGFTYGLGELQATEAAGGLALSVPDHVYKNESFYVTAYVYNAKKGQKVTLDLSEGLVFDGDETKEKIVDADGKRTTVFWKVRSTDKTGNFELNAASDKTKAKPVKIAVKGKSIYG